MIKKNNLFLLINSLSKDEKKHFKRFMLQYHKGEGNIYVRLFNAINKQNQYDRNKIISQIPILNSPSRLAKEKSKLYNLIMKSLSDYYYNRSENIRLKDILKQAEILYEKTLFEQCIKLLKKAKKIAYSYGKDSHLFEIFKWEKKLFYSGKQIKNLDKILQEEKIIIDKRNNRYDFEENQSVILKLTQREEMERNMNKF
ncbi:MAG: hypothetical protein ABII90_02085, partial [Bacteroidota bacterium]